MLQIGTWYINMLCENVKDFNWGVCALPNNAGIANENSIGGVTPVSIGSYFKLLALVPIRLVRSSIPYMISIQTIQREFPSI